MSETTKILFPFCIALIAGIVIGGKCCVKRDPAPLNVKVDTLIVRDTINVLKPVEIERYRIDSVTVPVTDTIRMRDTLFVYLDREKVVWRDSLCEVYASGIRPQVDSVRHFTSTRYVTIQTSVPVKVKTRWGVGIVAGYGVGKSGLTPYAGVGVSYNLLSW